MAKLTGPFFSLGASGAIAKTLVAFPWKGLNCLRKYVVPANPNTQPQQDQRGYLRDAVAAVHAAQGYAAHPLGSTDISAYALWASTIQAAMTWFNQAVRNCIDQLVDSLSPDIFCGGSTVAGVDTLTVSVWSWFGVATAGSFHYGTTKTSLINTFPAQVVGNHYFADITPLTTGVKYYWQFRPTAPAGAVGQRSGIYYGTPT